MDKQFLDNGYELITQLLDGELTDVQAAEVRQMIADSPELQLEFEQQSEIKNAIKKDKTAFVPPRSAKDNVLLALGIPLAVGTPVATAVVREGGNLIPILSAVAASLMTFSLFYGLNSNIGKDNSPVGDKVSQVSTLNMAKRHNVIILDENLNKSDNSSDNTARNSVSKANVPLVSSTEKVQPRVAKHNAELIANNVNSELVPNNDNNATQQAPTERIQLLETWNANIITSKNKAFKPNSNIFLSGNKLTPTEMKIVRDYLTVIRTSAGSNNLNSGTLDVSFLTNYLFQDIRGIMSAGLSWYDNNSSVQLKNPIFLGGGLEYTPTFTTLLSNEYYDTFVNGQLFIGKTPSYKLGAGISTYLGGLMNNPIVIGYYKSYTRDYQFIQLEATDGFFLGTEISF